MPAPKPSAPADWATTASGGDMTPPSGGKQAAGWNGGESPAHNFFNWWQNLVGQWTDYVRDFEISTHTWTVTQTFNLFAATGTTGAAGNPGVAGVSPATIIGGAGGAGNVANATGGAGAKGASFTGGAGGSGASNGDGGAGAPGIYAAGGASGAGLGTGSAGAPGPGIWADGSVTGFGLVGTLGATLPTLNSGSPAAILGVGGSTGPGGNFQNSSSGAGATCSSTSGVALVISGNTARGGINMDVVRTSDPASAANGDIWVRTDTNQLCIKIGGAIKRVTLT